MSSTLKISSLFNKFSWFSFLTLVIVSVIVFITIIVSYTKWKKLDVPTNVDCKSGFIKNFDNFPVNGTLERIPSDGELPNTTTKKEDQTGPGPFKSVFRNTYTGFFETEDIKSFTISCNVVSQDAPFSLVVESSENTKDWSPIQTSVINSKLGFNTVDFITSAKYLRLSLISSGRNVVVSSLRIQANVDNQSHTKSNIENTMFGSVISSTLLMTIMILFLLIMFVDVRGVYEYLVREQNKIISEKNK